MAEQRNLTEQNVKQYKVRIIPHLQNKTTTDEGTEVKAVYCRKTSPDEAALKAGFKPQRFFHLELFDAGSGRLGGDTKPHTLVIFENTDRILFDELNEIMKDEGNYVTYESNKVRLLNDPIPGLVRRRKCAQYYAYQINKTGRMVKLLQNRRQPDGTFEQEPTIMDYVRYFLFENEVNNEDDEIKFLQAVNRAMRFPVQATGEPTGDDVPEDKENGETEEP